MSMLLAAVQGCLQLLTAGWPSGLVLLMCFDNHKTVSKAQVASGKSGPGLVPQVNILEIWVSMHAGDQKS